MKAILHDVSRCRGCNACIDACLKEQGWKDEDSAGVFDREGLSGRRLTALAQVDGRFVRQHCLHCLEPSCAAACLVGALRKTPEGPVVYDETKCIGCRYCMIACPFEAPRYEWDRLTPLVRKCDLCHDREGGPACVEACPHDATIYGERAELLRIAHERIAERPDVYQPHVWGEHEAGGTSVLFVSDVSLDALWPTQLKDASIPDLTLPLAHATPFLFGGVLAGVSGLAWVIGRRNELAEKRADDGGEA